MKQIFILDENVYIQSHTCKDIEETTDDFNSLHLIITILDECHKIGLTKELADKYTEKAKALEKRRKLTNAVRIWSRFLERSDKQVWCSNHIEDLPSNIEHDRHVTDPTLFLSGILVTTDDKLKERLKEWSRKKKFNLNIMSPVDAVAHLQRIHGNVSLDVVKEQR